MKLSIIVPVYNQEKYLADAIQSALDQTVPCEIICVNDGSTDNSLEIARKFPIKVIDQVNKGLPSARNTGIMNATGDFILPLDADDILLPDTADMILATMRANPEADVIAPSFKEFGVRNTQIILMPNPTLEDFSAANRIGYFSAIRKSVLLEVGGYSPRMIWGYEDYHLWINLLTRGKKIITMPDILVLYRVKERSMIDSAREHHDELMAQIYKDFPTDA